MSALATLSGSLGVLGTSSGKAAAPVFPSGLEPTMWLAAESLNGQADGASIGTWTDSTGSRQWTQGTGTAKPILLKNSLNGYPGLFFDRTKASQLVGQSPLNIGSGPGYTLMTVLKPILAASQDQYGCIYTFNGGNGLFYRGDQHKFSFYYGSDHLTNGTITEGTPLIVTCRMAIGGGLDIRINGVANSTFSGGNTFAAQYIGCDNGSEKFNGMIYDLDVWSSKLSDTDTATVEAYYMTKYGI